MEDPFHTVTPMSASRMERVKQAVEFLGGDHVCPQYYVTPTSKYFLLHSQVLTKSAIFTLFITSYVHRVVIWPRE